MTVHLARNKTRDMVYMSMFAILIAICSWIAIPAAVPFTMQTFGVFVTLGFLGGKRGSISILLYLLMGAVGLPVFSGFRGGIGSLLGNTGGYIIGFLLSALVMWGMEKIVGRKKGMLLLSMILGLLVCYAFGTFWFVKVYAGNSGEIGIVTALSLCVFPFVIPDIMKIALALFLCKRLHRFMPMH